MSLQRDDDNVGDVIAKRSLFFLALITKASFVSRACTCFSFRVAKSRKHKQQNTLPRIRKKKNHFEKVNRVSEINVCNTFTKVIHLQNNNRDAKKKTVMAVQRSQKLKWRCVKFN